MLTIAAEQAEKMHKSKPGKFVRQCTSATFSGAKVEVRGVSSAGSKRMQFLPLIAC